MWTEKIDGSAVAVANFLGPDGLDRSTAMPVAALAVWSVTKGMVALVGQRGEPGRVFPTEYQELPVFEKSDTDYVTTQIASFLDPIIQKLRIPPKEIVRVSGLAGRNFDSDPSLPCGLAPDLMRDLRILPFRIDVDGKPQVLGAWYPPTEAARQICARRSTTERAVGATILSRTMSASPWPRAA